MRNLFGKFINIKLKELKITLRELSRRCNIDASNLSKMERGVISPPKNRKTLEKIANALNLTKKESNYFIDLARQDNEMVPENLKYIKN